MIRISARITPAVLLVAALLAAFTACDAAGSKSGMLLRLTQPGRTPLTTHAAESAGNYPAETAQLALDLIFTNWASRLSNAPSDFSNVDAIIASLVKALDDRTIDWAAKYFSTTPAPQVESPLPSPEDPRVRDLFDLKGQFKSAALDYKESSPLKAVSSLQSAARLCQKLYLDMSEALILKLLGDHYSYDMARYPAAEFCYERAAWTFSAYRLSASSATVYDDSGTLSAQSGRYANATEQYTEAARQWEQLARQDPRGYKYRDSAGREYMKAGEAQMAAGDTAAGLELMSSKGLVQLRAWATPNKSYDLLIRNLIKVAEIRRGLGNAADSLELLKQAQRACEGQKDPLLTAKVFEELAKTYTALNQSANASIATGKQNRILRATADAGESALTKLAGRGVPNEAVQDLRNAAERAARAYGELGNHPKAAETWREVAAAYQKAGMVGEQIRCLRALGATLDLEQKPKESLGVRFEAVTLARAANQNTVAADIVHEMIEAFKAEGDIPNALEGFTELAPIVEEAGNMREAARVLEARGGLLVSSGDYESAIVDFRNSRMKYLSQVGDAWAAGEVALELASAQKSAKQENEARATLESAIEDIESSYPDEASASDNVEDRAAVVVRLYKELAKACIRDGAPDVATQLFRKARRYTWFSQAVIELRNDESDPKMAQWAKNVDVTLPDGVFPQPNDSGQRIMGDTWGAFAESCWWLEKQYPREYAALPVDPVDLLKCRGLLPEGLLAVEYLPTESSLYVFICGRDRSICRQLATRKSSVDALVSRLRRTLRNCEESISTGIPIPPIVDWQESSFLEIKEPLSALYTQLLTPIRGNLANCRRLAFILPQDFAGLPIHALISPEGKKGPVFLIQEYEISYVARGMLSSLIAPSSRAIDPRTDYVSIFADPESNLPGAQKEATNVKSAYIGSRWYVGSERATATNFLNELKQGGIVHIAAHHRIDPNPSGFRLLLAPDKDSDGTVGVQELSGIESPGLQLVVLSACDSIGSSDPISSGPARAAEVFSLAGAQSVLGGLWKVADEAASRLMGDFYRGLNRGKSRTEALQSAQLSVIESKQFAHPFYWACFALYGNPR